MLEKHRQRPSPPKLAPCRHKGCHRTTRERKPFCPDHVDKHDYVKRLKKKIASKQKEEAKVEKRGMRAIKEDSITLQEVRVELAIHGPKTLSRLAKDVNLATNTAKGYVDFLERRDLVKYSTNTRGTLIVEPKFSSLN